MKFISKGYATMLAMAVTQITNTLSIVNVGYRSMCQVRAKPRLLMRLTSLAGLEFIHTAHGHGGPGELDKHQ